MSETVKISSPTWMPEDCSTAVQQTAFMIYQTFNGEGSGHDWWHIYRVWMNTRAILKDEQITDSNEIEVAEISALVHDIADHKFHDGDDTIGPETAFIWCTKNLKWEDKRAKRIKSIVANISFKGIGVDEVMEDYIGKIVQDADRLDALGAIGIARTFAYGGFVKQPIHDPELSPKQHQSFNEYKNERSTTYNHFYEKLLFLKDRMNTKSGKIIAEKRTNYMLEFLQTFRQEWAGFK
jgi:uncharacterized protein